jgi:catechol 2,3-dioxygenase-like lactoylglutathione lyase family enzyme
VRAQVKAGYCCSALITNELSWIEESAAMIDHTGIGVADVGRSATFYDAALGALGMRRLMQMPDNKGTDGIGYGFDYPVFWIDRYHLHSVKQHTAFAAKTRAEVEGFYAAALRQAEPTMERKICAGRITTLHLCSIQMVTTSRRSSARRPRRRGDRIKTQIGCGA